MLTLVNAVEYRYFSFTYYYGEAFSGSAELQYDRL